MFGDCCIDYPDPNETEPVLSGVGRQWGITLLLWLFCALSAKYGIAAYSQLLNVRQLMQDFA